jgi:hypothetical protein
MIGALKKMKEAFRNLIKNIYELIVIKFIEIKVSLDQNHISITKSTDTEIMVLWRDTYRRDSAINKLLKLISYVAMIIVAIFLFLIYLLLANPFFDYVLREVSYKYFGRYSFIGAIVYVSIHMICFYFIFIPISKVVVPFLTAPLWRLQFMADKHMIRWVEFRNDGKVYACPLKPKHNNDLLYMGELRDLIGFELKPAKFFNPAIFGVPNLENDPKSIINNAFAICAVFKGGRIFAVGFNEMKEVLNVDIIAKLKEGHAQALADLGDYL